LSRSHKNPVWDLAHYAHIFRTYLGQRVYIVFTLTLLGGLAEGFGFLMLIPILPALVQLDSERSDQATDYPEAIPGIGGWIQDFFELLGLQDSVAGMLVMITAAFIFKGLLVFFAQGYNAVLKGRLQRELRNRMSKHYSQMQYAYYASRDTGHFLNVIHLQIDGLLGAFSSFVKTVTHLLNALIYLAMGFLIAWRFGLMALMVGSLLLILFRRLNAYTRGLSRKSSGESGHFSKLVVQALHAFKYLTATARMSTIKNEISHAVSRLSGYQIRRGVAAALTDAIREPIAVVAIMLIVIVQLVVLQRPLSPILVSILLFYRGIGTAMAIQGNLQSLMGAIGSAELVGDEFFKQQLNKESGGDQRIARFSKAIEFQNVYFRYGEHSNEILRDVSLSIRANTTTALVGESGAGKSTLVDMLTLMLRPTGGNIRIDGKLGETIHLASWRQQVGYVSQETVIFDDTIANNICFWEGDSTKDQALMDQIIKAAEQAHIADFIETLDAGYQTMVGDRGIRLSGGQRQRLFIARELFRKPNLLILDEATSALDSESEREIQKSIDELKGSTTIVIIAHRLSTIRNVDRVYVLEKGRLVEDGSYEELRNRDDSHFGKLISMQVL